MVSILGEVGRKVLASRRVVRQAGRGGEVGVRERREWREEVMMLSLILEEGVVRGGVREARAVGRVEGLELEVVRR